MLHRVPYVPALHRELKYCQRVSGDLANLHSYQIILENSEENVFDYRNDHVFLHAVKCNHYDRSPRGRLPAMVDQSVAQ